MHCALQGLQCPAWVFRLVNLDLRKNISHILHPFVGSDHSGHKSIWSIYKAVFLKLLFQKLFFILFLYIWSAMLPEVLLTHPRGDLWTVVIAEIVKITLPETNNLAPENWCYFQGGTVSLRDCNKIPFIKNWIDFINPLWTGGFATPNVSGITRVVPSSQ